MKKILYIGLIYIKDEEEKLFNICKNRISVAHFKFQTNLLTGIEDNNFDVDILGMYPVGNFPYLCKKIFFKTRMINEKYLQLGFVNLPIIKHIVRKYKLLINIEKWIKRNKNNKMIIMVYDIYLPFLKALYSIKKNILNVLF